MSGKRWIKYGTYFELLFELIFEGSLEIGTSKKVSMPIRIVVMTVFFIVVGGFLYIAFVDSIIRYEKQRYSWMAVYTI